MRSTRDILIVAALFLAVAQGLGAFGVWKLMGIQPPHGLVVQGLLFFVLYLVLSQTLFKPYLGILDERDLQTQGRLKDVEALKLRAHELRVAYEARMQEAHLAAIRAREAIAMEAEAAEKQRILAAKHDAKTFLERQEKILLDEAARVKQALQKDQAQWVKDILARLDGDQVGSSVRAMAVGQ